MNNLSLAFSIVFPLFSMMALGYLLRVIKIFHETFLRQLNNLCFKVFLPMILFVNIYKSDFRGLFSPKLIVFAIVSVIVSFLLLMVTVPFIEKSNSKKGVVVQGVFRSNFILFGIPIAASLYGDANTSVTAILIAFVIPLFNALSVVALESFSTKKSGVKFIARSIARNPLIIASACAFFVVIARIQLPIIVESTITDISGVATPLALIILGGSFQFHNLKKSPKILAFSVLAKLVLIPAIFVPISICFGFRGMELAALLAMFASPTAVSSFTMAQIMGADDTLAGQIVAVGSCLSIVTIFTWITALKQFGLI